MNPDPKILWEWKAGKAERTIRVILTYSDIELYKEDEVAFWKDLLYEISDGCNAMNVEQFRRITEKAMIEHIIDKAHYYGWKKILEGFFKVIDIELE